MPAALAHHVDHPVNVYVREDDVLPAVDGWPLKIFASAAWPQRSATWPPRRHGRWRFPRAAVIVGCDAKLARYQAAPDAGANPVTVAGWTRDVTAERAAALARAAARPAGPEPFIEEASVGQWVVSEVRVAPYVHDQHPLVAEFSLAAGDAR